MNVQVYVVAVVVAACAVAAVWQLMPARFRAQLAARLARAPLPGRMQNYLSALEPASGCGGCGGSCKPQDKTATGGAAPVVFYRTKR